jgi:hypothetical protein
LAALSVGTGEKFVSSVIDIGEQFFGGVVDNGKKFGLFGYL